MLLSATANFQRALLKAGVKSELIVYDAMPHAFWHMIETPESKEAPQMFRCAPEPRFMSRLRWRLVSGRSGRTIPICWRPRLTSDWWDEAPELADEISSYLLSADWRYDRGNWVTSSRSRVS